MFVPTGTDGVAVRNGAASRCNIQQRAEYDAHQGKAPVLKSGTTVLLGTVVLYRSKSHAVQGSFQFDSYHIAPSQFAWFGITAAWRKHSVGNKRRARAK